MKICHIILVLNLISTWSFSQSAHEIPNINQQAKDIVQSNLSYIKRNYHGYSGGFRTEASFYSQSSREPIVNFLNILNNHREFRINVPSRHRMGILNKGYLNQHQTSSSSGCLCPDSRNAKEAAMINWPKSRYSILNNYVKPKYGSMGILGQTMKAASHYGDDVYILDENKISGRVTYTLADSLGISSSYFNGQSPIFIPVEFQELLLGKLMKNRLNQIGNQIYANSYTEIQIWGALKMNSLKEFRFTSNPPNQKLTSYLVDNNVRIRQIICSSSKVGDEGCLKDYAIPSVIQIENFLKAKKYNQAKQKLTELVTSGYKLSLLYRRLKSSHQKWMRTIIKDLTDLGEQSPEAWIGYTKELTEKGLMSQKDAYRKFALYGNLKAFITYVLVNNISEKELDLKTLSKAVNFALDEKSISSIKQHYPQLTAILKNRIKSFIVNGQNQSLNKITSQNLIAFAPKNYETAIGRILLGKIKKGVDPYQFMKIMDQKLKDNFLKGIENCLNTLKCISNKETSYGLITTAYKEDLNFNAQNALKKYFKEIVSIQTFGKQGTLVDMINSIRKKEDSLDRFYQDISSTIKSLKYKLGISPYETAIELEKDKDRIGQHTFDELASDLKKTPHQAIFFKEKGMGGPVTPTYYHMEQIRKGTVTLPDIYPLDIFIQRMIQRAKSDPNTQLYRLFLSNLPEIFIRQKQYKDIMYNIFDEVLKNAPSHYKYTIMQSKSYADFKVNRKDDVLQLVKDKLYNWDNLAQSEKNIFLESLDVAPLYLLESKNDRRLNQSFINDMDKYLSSREFSQFKKTQSYKEWEKERDVFPRNYFYGKIVSNKISDFLEKYDKFKR